MEYYINPSWFYWIKVIDGIQTAFIVFGVVFGILVVCLSIAYFAERSCIFDEDDEQNVARIFLFLRISIVVFIVAVLGAVFFTNRNTLIEIQIAKYATRENVDTTVESIKSIIDYVVESIGSLK